VIGEKLLNHTRASDSDPSWAATLPLFATKIKRIFTADQLAALPADFNYWRDLRCAAGNGTRYTQSSRWNKDALAGVPLGVRVLQDIDWHAGSGKAVEQLLRSRKEAS
jgi:hypothetical protein